MYHQSDPDDQFDGWFDETGSRLAWSSKSEAGVSLADLDGPPDAEPLSLRRSDAGAPRAIFDPRGNWLAAPNVDSLTFWQVGQPWARVLRGHTDSVSQLIFTPDSRGLVSCARTTCAAGPSIRRRGRPASSRTSSLRTSCYGVAVAPDGREVVRGYGGVQLVRLHEGGRWLLTEKWPTDYTHEAVAIDASGRVAAAGGLLRPGTSKRLRVWERPDVPKHDWPLEVPGEPETTMGWAALAWHSWPSAGSWWPGGGRAPVRRRDGSERVALADRPRDLG